MPLGGRREPDLRLAVRSAKSSSALVTSTGPPANSVIRLLVRLAGSPATFGAVSCAGRGSSRPTQRGGATPAWKARVMLVHDAGRFYCGSGGALSLLPVLLNRSLILPLRNVSATTAPSAMIAMIRPYSTRVWP